MADLLRPDTLLVATAWVTAIPGLTAGVGPQLPADTATWKDGGFVQVSVVGGAPDLDLPVAKPVLQIDTWAVSPSSGRPPWGKAAQLAEIVRAATYNLDMQNLAVDLGAKFSPAIVTSSYPISEPRRVFFQDTTAYARSSFDVQLFWLVPE